MEAMTLFADGVTFASIGVVGVGASIVLIVLLFQGGSNARPWLRVVPKSHLDEL